MTGFDSVCFSESGPLVTRIGMGCWAAGGHGWGAVNDLESISAIRYAYDRGVNFFDTADVYGFGKSEKILRQALGKNLNSVLISSKGGVRWNESGKVWNDSSPKYLELAVESSLKRLGIESIPLYYIHKLDTKTPIAEIMGTLLTLRKAGKIREIGVSNFSSVQLVEALRVAPICAVQIRCNLLDHIQAEKLAHLCTRYNIKLIAWGVLADGLLTGKFNASSTFGVDDHRSCLPDFQGVKFLENLQLIEKIQSIARTRKISLGQLALRWVMDKYKWSCSLFGAKTVSQVEENLGAEGWHLSQEEITLIDQCLN